MDPARRRSRSLLASPLALAARLAMDPAPADSTSKELAPDYMEMAKEVVVEEDSGDVERTPESFVPDPQIASDSVTPELQELAPDSEMVPDSLPPGSFICARCHLVHEDRQAWNRAHSRLWPCSRCGLVHAEYIIRAMLHGLDEFDCELFIQHYKDLLPRKDDAKASVSITKIVTCSKSI